MHKCENCDIILKMGQYLEYIIFEIEDKIKDYNYIKGKCKVSINI